MYVNSILAASALASLVAAVPMAQPAFAKREVVWQTQTEVAYTTIPVTVTHWLEPGETAPAAVAPAGYGNKGHGHRGHHGHGKPGKPGKPSGKPSKPAAPPAAPSSVDSPPQPPPVPQQPTTQQAPPPAPTTQAPPPAAPTTTQQNPPPPAYTPPTQPEPQPSQPSSGGGGNGLTGMAAAGNMHSGDMTYWTPALGACGWTNTESEPVVAIAESLFDQYDVDGNPNHNKLCGKYVNIIGENGSPTKAKVVDRCGGCATTDLDLSPSLFKTVVPNGDGRVPGVDWSFA